MTPVDAYLSACPAERAARLAEIRALVHRAAPDVVEGMEWQMPVFRHGAHWCAMANRAAYVSVYLHDQQLVAAIVAGAPGMKSGKGCLNIPDKTALPEEALLAAFRQVLGVR